MGEGAEVQPLVKLQPHLLGSQNRSTNCQTSGDFAILTNEADKLLRQPYKLTFFRLTPDNRLGGTGEFAASWREQSGRMGEGAEVQPLVTLQPHLLALTH
eukprot:scaffold163741_cov66-Cyclotella_meneghiniana.AAC.2